VIDRYTYYVLQFLEGVTPNSKATVGDLVNSFNISYLLSSSSSSSSSSLSRGCVVLSMIGCFQWYYSGSARVFRYTVYRGFLNRVYGILQLKYGYSVYHFL